MVDRVTQFKTVKKQRDKIVCPSCQEAAKAPHTPFCSVRCSQLDLGKWLSGDYVFASLEEVDGIDVDVLLYSDEADRKIQADKES